MIKPGMQGCQLLGKSNVINKKEDVDEGNPMPQTIIGFYWIGYIMVNPYLYKL